MERSIASETSVLFKFQQVYFIHNLHRHSFKKKLVENVRYFLRKTTLTFIIKQEIYIILFKGNTSSELKLKFTIFCDISKQETVVSFIVQI